jgi:hypothetical protein
MTKLALDIRRTALPRTLESAPHEAELVSMYASMTITLQVYQLINFQRARPGKHSGAHSWWQVGRGSALLVARTLV